MRALAPFLLLPLAACGQPTAEQAPIAAAEANGQRAAEDDGRIACARAGQAALARDCTLDRTDGERGLMLTLRHPDGGFRRLLVTRDGRGVVAADGAETARVRVIGADRIEVAVGGDRYRLPATVKAPGAGR